MRSVKTIFLVLLSLSTISFAAEVEIEGTSDGYRLLRNGKPYFIKGICGDQRLDLLTQIGGNTFRTSAGDQLTYDLEAAQKNNLAVCAALPLMSERDGFDYDNAVKVSEQLDRIKKAILRHKDHPSLLLWTAGEDLTAGGDNEYAWRSIEDTARMAHLLDSNHPVMTIVSEITPQKVRAIATLCPNVDILGVKNGSAVNMAERVRECGWTKPFILAEHGSRSVRDSVRAPWGAPFEETSTQKADRLLLNYQRNVAPAGQCVGSFAAPWSQKLERTTTWCGSFLKSGEHLGSIDALHFAFNGKFPANRAPKILELHCEAHGKDIDPESRFTATLAAYDDDGDKLSVSWEVREESRALKLEDASESEPALHPEAIIETKSTRAVLRAPQIPGPYRLYVTVRDAKGHAATGNIVFNVKR